MFDKASALVLCLPSEFGMMALRATFLFALRNGILLLIEPAEHLKLVKSREAHKIILW
jgi:hypothetical protein